MTDKTIDKRALKRQYLEAPSRAGVFSIRHLPSGRLLVDGSTDAQASLTRHAFELRMGRHRDRALQHDWNTDGNAGFVFDVLDVVKSDADPAFDLRHQLRALIALWREEFGACKNGTYTRP